VENLLNLAWMERQLLNSEKALLKEFSSLYTFLRHPPSSSLPDLLLEIVQAPRTVLRTTSSLTGGTPGASPRCFKIIRSFESQVTFDPATTALLLRPRDSMTMMNPSREIQGSSVRSRTASSFSKLQDTRLSCALRRRLHCCHQEAV
jgi:hypothetical protein